jgi:hypothetical protein
MSHVGTMLRRVAGTASWHVFKDGAKMGDVSQAPDGTWYAQGEGVMSPIQAPTRKEAARTLTGGI